MATYVSANKTVYPLNMAGGSYTNATYQAFCTSMEAALTGVGLVQTSDTGQQVGSTATQPGVGSYSGYQIWRFSDAAQATDPVFLKIEYGRKGWNGGYTLRVTVGQGSNGSGTLTGTTSTAVDTQCAVGTGGSATALGQDYAFFGDGNFWLSDGMLTSLASYDGGPRNYINIARSRNSSGSLDGRGVFILNPCSPMFVNQAQFVRWVSGDAKVYAPMSTYCAPMGSHTADATVAGEKFAWPHFYYDNGVKRAWATWSCKRADLPSSPSSFMASPYGTNYKWISWNKAPWAQHRAAEGDTDCSTFCALVMRWE